MNADKLRACADRAMSGTQTYPYHLHGLNLPAGLGRKRADFCRAWLAAQFEEARRTAYSNRAQAQAKVSSISIEEAVRHALASV